MISYEESITIDAEPSAIFRFLSDVRGYPEWMNIQDPEPMTAEMQVRGSRWRANSDQGPFVIEFDRYEEDRMVGYRTIEGPMDWTGEFRLEPIAEGRTTVMSSGRIQLSGFRKLLQPMMQAEVRKSEAQELAKLKELVEGNGST